MTRHALVLAMAAAAGACSRSDPAPPAPPPPATTKAEWRVECRPVRDARHQACYGPGRDAGRPAGGAFDFYQVSVERKEGSDPSHVLFVKRLAVADVDAKLLDERAAPEVVRYDAASRTVRFETGREPVAYRMEKK